MKCAKRIAALSLVLAIGLCACSNSNPTPSQSAAESQPAESQPATTVDYPTAAITMIVNYSAGGGTDLAARALSSAAANVLGEAITVSNVSGGTGSVGVTELANSKADGYTIGVATLAPLALVPYQLDVTYTPDSFEYICAFGQYGYGIVVAANSPYQTLDDLIEDAKTKTVNFGGTGYPQPFAMEDLGDLTGASFNFVSYPSTTDMVTDVLGGFVPVVVGDMASFASYVKSGDMRLLASATTNRWEVAPDVETLQEMGYDVALESYLGMAVPAGIDPEILQILRDAFAQAYEDSAFQEIMQNCNQGLVYMDGDEYEQMVRDMYEEYGQRMAE